MEYTDRHEEQKDMEARAKNDVSITDPKTIEAMYRKGKPGYYLNKGGGSFKAGPVFDTPYSQFDPTVGGWVIYSDDEGIVYSYIEDKYGKWSLDTAADYRNYTCNEIDDDGDHDCYSW